MTPTILHIAGFAKPASYSTVSTRPNYVSSMTMDQTIDPPKNIAGKECVVHATFCNYETNKSLSSANRANLSAFFSWNINSMWSQIYPGTLTSPLLQPALGVRDLEFGLYNDMGPRVVRIPHGPFPVRFLCRGNNLDNPLTRGFLPNDTNISVGTNPYASLTLTTGNNTLTLNGVDVTIPIGTYSTITLMAAAIAPVLPSEYKIRIDGNTTDTRLMLTRDAGSFTVTGTFASAAGFQGTSFPATADYLVMTIALHLTPVE